MFRDCKCGHTKDHHSNNRVKRCLNHGCDCKQYVPKTTLKEEGKPI